MKRFVWLLKVGGFLIVLSGIAKGQQNSQRPNFIVVMTDDQGYGDVGYMGNTRVKTPNLDAMSKEAVRLDRFYTAPVCSPTRASVLTGRNPTRTGVFSWGHALRPQETSFVEILRANGYQTAFFGKWHLGSVMKKGATNPGAFGFDTWCAAANYYDNDPIMSKNGSPVRLIGESSEVTVNLALEHIAQVANTDAPFVIFIWFGSPHVPHKATEELKALYPDASEELKNYYGELTGIDRAMGKLRSELRAMGLAENTLVWFSSDNGGLLPEADNGGLRDKKGSLWEGGIRVPALVEWLGTIVHSQSTIPTGAVDIFPTLLELAGVDIAEIDRPIDGISLVPLLNGKMSKRKRPLGFWNYTGVKGNLMRSDDILQDYERSLGTKEADPALNEGLLNVPEAQYSGLDTYPYLGTYAWMDNDWKLYWDGKRFKLYNLVKDKGEMHDLAAMHPGRVKKMKKALFRWQRSVAGSIRGTDYH